ncbi:MAG: STAS domain-containing protein [Elusimicrobia bacterium]|nr:STAS domain-containing protein [Elusimicrobiota bacterium]
MILVPKLLTTLKDYDRSQFAADAMAGVVVGVVAVPLALAFAIASGVSPDRGLYTAAVAGFLISALGGSRVQIGGPTGAFVVIVYGIVQQFGLDGLALCTILAGGMLVVMGLARMGTLLKFIPYPVTTGFTSGIALIILSSQVKDLLGLSMGSVPVEFLAKWQAYLGAIGTSSAPAAALSAFTLAVLWLWPKLDRRLPSPVVALVLATWLAHALGLSVETIGARFGHMPHGLPAPSLPAWHAGDLARLWRPALTVALLAAIESLLSAVVADGMIGSRHRSSMELVAQGVANLASPLFGGIPATGAIARTATNVKSGGRTPVAGMIHAAVVLLTLLYAAPLVEAVPLCVLAAILVIVAYHMSEWRSFCGLLRGPRSDAAVLLATFLLTVLVDLTVAVEVGMILAAFLFMRRMAEMTEVDPAALERAGDEGADSPVRAALEGVEVYDLNGPFFFGAAGKLREVLDEIHRTPRAFVLQMANVPFMDASGLRALEEFQARCRKRRTALILTGVGPQPLRVLERTGARARLDHVLTGADLAEALQRVPPAR